MERNDGRLTQAENIRVAALGLAIESCNNETTAAGTIVSRAQEFARYIESGA